MAKKSVERKDLSHVNIPMLKNYGSAYQNTADTAIADKAVEELKRRDIEIITHVILGLPGESREDMLESVKYVGDSGVQGIKLQLLHYLKGTDLGDLYEKNPDQFHVLSLEEYADIIALCIAHLNPDIVIHRLSGDGNGEYLLAPLWSKDKRRVLNTISRQLKVKNITQGCLLKP